MKRVTCYDVIAAVDAAFSVAEHEGVECLPDAVIFVTGNHLTVTLPNKQVFEIEVREKRSKLYEK